MFFGKKKDPGEAWSKTAGSDSRQFPRLGIKTIVLVRALGREAHCRLRDLSLGGVAFTAPWELTTSDPVSIEIPAPDGLGRRKLDPARVEGRVCRSARSPKGEGWLVGVRFTPPHPSVEARTLIKLWSESFGEAAEKAPNASGERARG